MRIDAWVNLKVIKADGTIQERRWFKSKSYVLAVLDLLYVQMSNVSQNITDTSNAARSVGTHANNLGMTGAAGASTRSLVVGTGVTAVAIANYALATQIAHGTGVGQLDYQAASFGTSVTSGSTRKWSLLRNFINSSGGSITVNECGIYAIATVTPYFFCIARDLISGGVAVPNGETLAMTYTLQVTV